MMILAINQLNAQIILL